jgi:hypothetical protein
MSWGISLGAHHGDDFSGPAAARARGEGELVGAAPPGLVDAFANVWFGDVFLSKRGDGKQE